MCKEIFDITARDTKNLNKCIYNDGEKDKEYDNRNGNKHQYLFIIIRSHQSLDCLSHNHHHK